MAIWRQSYDCGSCKRGAIGKNPTDRAKNGSKRHLLTDGRGAPIALLLTGANVHDVTMAAKLIDAIIIRRPPVRTFPQNICLDKGYDDDKLRKHLQRKNLIFHIPYKVNRINNIIKRKPGRKKARRWVVERVGAWLNQFRRLKIRYEHKSQNHQAFIKFACSIICYRMAF